MVDSDQQFQRFPVWWKRSILFHSTWYSWWWQVRRRCSVDAVNEKPLGKCTETKFVCVCVCVTSLSGIGIQTLGDLYNWTNLDVNHRCLLCVLKITQQTFMWGLNERYERLQWQTLASVGLFRDSGQRYPDLVDVLCCLVAPCVSRLDQSCGAGSQAARSQLFDCMAKAKTLLPQPWNVS